MGALCGKGPKPKEEAENKVEEKEVVVEKEEVVESDEHDKQQVPEPIQNDEIDEDVEKLRQTCLDSILDVPREGSIQNINEHPVEVVAVKRDLDLNNVD